MKRENCCPYCLQVFIIKIHLKKRLTGCMPLLPLFGISRGLKFPIHVYPSKLDQVDARTSDEKLKHECELNAAHNVLPELKGLLGRIPVTFLGDSLYANEPMIKLLEQLYWII